MYNKKGFTTLGGLSHGANTADHFIIYSKRDTIPLVAFGLKPIKDKDTGEQTDRCLHNPLAINLLSQFDGCLACLPHSSCLASRAFQEGYIAYNQGN